MAAVAHCPKPPKTFCELRSGLVGADPGRFPGRRELAATGRLQRMG